MASTSSIHTICVYCGSADGVHAEYLSAARQMGALIAARGLRLVYGAGKTGLMGALAQGALSAGGDVAGFVPENMNLPALVHEGLGALEVLPDIQMRKARMSAAADAFIALPGGYGTFDELFETLTWAQIGLHHKPVGLLNVRGYYDPLLSMIRRASEDHFIYAEQDVVLVSDSQPENLLQKLLDAIPPVDDERRPS